MALTQRLDLRQAQTLVMTPQLQQAIKLLQLSNVELVDYVERELEQNPLLEMADPAEPPTAADQPAAEARPESEGTQDLTQITQNDAAGTAETPLDTDHDTTYDEAGPSAFARERSGGGTSFEDDDFDATERLTETKTLRDHLYEQLAVEITDPAERLIGGALIEMVDECGWITEPLAHVAAALGAPVEQVETVLLKLHKFEPTGVCARSLAECLALQLRERDRCDPAMQTLLDNLDLLAARRMPDLMRLCGVDSADLADMIAEIKQLNPKPAREFDFSPVHTVVPDILMRPNPSGGWVVELNHDTLPKVLVNRRYHAVVQKGTLSKADRDYMAERLTAANWLVRSLDQRATTILKVASEIVRQQDAFFIYGVQYLRPLILRDIATAIEMHESTVSRVTSNKYMQTPRGIFELKYFFSTAIAGSAGTDSHSAEAVRFRIQKLITGEAADAILSDDTIVDLLQKDGIEIARRTVAKYREQLRIPSSVQRRREKLSASA
ncbi:MAG: rpoN [Rhodospirillales bacterium]|nr:rpoN [Rhodospirillales bacterium]